MTGHLHDFDKSHPPTARFYTVRFPEAVYVLHVFQKKSRRGAKTPKREMAVIEKRLRDATEIHEASTRRKKEKR